VHVALDRRPLAVDGARCRRCLSCPSGISRARRVHEATGPSCRRSGRQPGSNEVRPGSKGCRDRHLRRNAADARRKSPHRDRRADLPPPTASRRVRPLVSLAPRSEPNLTFLTRWRARLGAPYHSIQRPARVCRLRDVPLRTQNVRRGSAQNVPRWSRTAHRAGVRSGRGARARDPGRAVRPASA